MEGSCIADNEPSRVQRRALMYASDLSLLKDDDWRAVMLKIAVLAIRTHDMWIPKRAC